MRRGRFRAAGLAGVGVGGGEGVGRLQVALLAGGEGLGFVDAVEDVGFVPELRGFLRGVNVVGAGENAFGGGAAALEDQGEIVEGEGLAA